MSHLSSFWIFYSFTALVCFLLYALFWENEKRRRDKIDEFIHKKTLEYLARTSEFFCKILYSVDDKKKKCLIIKNPFFFLYKNIPCFSAFFVYLVRFFLIQLQFHHHFYIKIRTKIRRHTRAFGIWMASVVIPGYDRWAEILHFKCTIQIYFNGLNTMMLHDTITCCMREWDTRKNTAF